jgi:hypothetical protein
MPTVSIAIPGTLHLATALSEREITLTRLEKKLYLPQKRAFTSPRTPRGSRPQDLVNATAVDSRYGSLEEERIRENQKTGAGPGNWKKKKRARKQIHKMQDLKTHEMVWPTRSKGRSRHEVQGNQSMKRLNW